MALFVFWIYNTHLFFNNNIILIPFNDYHMVLKRRNLEELLSCMRGTEQQQSCHGGQLGQKWEDKTSALSIVNEKYFYMLYFLPVMGYVFGLIHNLVIIVFVNSQK